MSKTILSVLAVAAALGLAGCGPSEEPKQQTAAPGGAPQTEQTLSDKAMEVAKEARQAAGEKVEAAATATSEAASAAKETASEAAGAAMEKGKEIAQATIDKANELIQQVKDYIAENKLDSAEGVMEQLRKLRDSLPQALQDEIAKLEAMLSGGQSAPAPTGN
jgi:hypothetical protein